MEPVSGSPPREEMRDRMAALCAPLLEAEGFEFVDAEWSSGAGNVTARLFVHRPGGVTVGECQRIHRMVMPMLRVESIVDDNTSFEVASPGLKRPLRRAADFRRAVGYYLTIRRRVADEPDCEERLVGKLLAADAALTVALDGGGEVEIPLDEVIEGRFDIRM
ncbi:hypothetical protein HN371_18070 [Candidatus Poribacteria bacterium]|nr:hypothetical protein [Candidatus Poribacteria bacterium]MBT5535991.1 hypothetical protein [Candidatus Poribacteria bacterium]MBT5712906.1 hypothetical protein [Candidatus Poribacteria bacterium]MBT7101423.1 hypothetical protein [Candidatus Poribacteria bacterium]MBT7808753.1 hypothetical protein [Candidatus Poribacteria bacterium]